MRITFICFIILLNSCTVTKFREIELDVTQELKGQVKQIRSSKFYYDTRYSDSIMRREDIVTSYDRKQKIINQNGFNPGDNDGMIYNYNSFGLLESKFVNFTKFRFKTTYKYDSKKNLIEYNHFENDSLEYGKVIKYDKYNNVVERVYYRSNNYKNYTSDKAIIDYKTRTVILKGFDEKGQERNTYLKTTYNKRGYIIRSEIINPKVNGGLYSITDYDKNGNLTKVTAFDKNGTVKSTMTAKNTYDKKGNIILRERFGNGKLSEKSIFEISYY